MNDFKVNLFCIGAQKSGTTHLYYLLSQHPQIFTCKRKEPQYFVCHDGFDESINDYMNYFQGYGSQKYIGDFSTGYMHTNGTAQRIYNKFGKNIKLLASIRDPVSRAKSAYYMEKSRMSDYRTLEDALDPANADDYDLERFGDPWDPKFLKNGLYFEQLEPYFEVFGQENIRIIIFEEFVRNRKATIEDICYFLDIDNYEFDYEINKFRTYGYKSEKLQKLANLYTPLKGAIKKIVPLRLILWLKSRLNHYNRKELVKEELSVALKQKLYDYYIGDITSLGKMIGMDLVKEWSFDKYNIRLTSEEPM